jgi:hypothetical protein
MPREALFLAGKVFQRSGWWRHLLRGAASRFCPRACRRGEIAPLTRDVRRYRNYFPTVELVAPTG